MKVLQGKIALVTGVGRRQGIGYAVCEKLASLGADIFYTYWRPYDADMQLPGFAEDPQMFADDFMSHGVKASCVEVDLRTIDAAEVLFDAADKVLGGSPDILINNACVSTRQPFIELTADLLDAHYEVNVRATALLCKEFILRFQKETGGKIVNLTSGQSLSIMEGEIPYAVTKAGVEMLALQLSFELRSRGITINAVDPGPTDTGWITAQMRNAWKKESNQMKIHTPQEAAELVVSCIVGEKEAITGSIIHAER
jgi:3-oxoacyl-[acyl-carrier protein] reductase